MASIRPRNGQYNVQVRRTGHQHQSNTFPTRAEAEKWAREVEARLDKGIEVDVGSLKRETVQSILERFRDEELPSRKGERWERVRIKFWIDTEPWVKHRLDQPLPAAFRAWVARREKVVKASSVNREMNLLSGIFAVAIKKWGVPLQANPVHLVQRPKVDRKRRGRVWRPEDLERLRDAAGSKDAPDVHHQPIARDYVVPAVELGIETMMRRGELCSVLADNVFLEKRYLVLEDTKNGDVRQVPLSRRAVEILEPLVNAALALEDRRVIPVNKDTLGVEYRKLRAAAGLDNLRLHDARHTGATRGSKKLSILELSAAGGWRSLQSLKGYYHADPTEIAEKLG